MYVAAWLSDILVESSTGTRPSVNGLSEFTRTSAVRWVTTREIPLGCFKAARYNTGLTRDVVVYILMVVYLSKGDMTRDVMVYFLIAV